MTANRSRDENVSCIVVHADFIRRNVWNIGWVCLSLWERCIRRTAELNIAPPRCLRYKLNRVHARFNFDLYESDCEVLGNRLFLVMTYWWIRKEVHGYPWIGTNARTWFCFEDIRSLTVYYPECVLSLNSCILWKGFVNEMRCDAMRWDEMVDDTPYLLGNVPQWADEDPYSI